MLLIAFIGEFADKPRYQGGGSSHINSFKITSALDTVSGIDNITYAQGFVTDRDETVDELLDEAVELAKNSDVAVIFAGLPESFESEGFDRKHMRMPDCQLKLIDEVAKVNKNVVVVLHNGSAVEMPFADKVKGILEMYLGGQNVGTAETALLFGDANPSGKLAETFPVKLSHNPSYLNFPGNMDNVNYAEGIFVGYRYYDEKGIEPLFPFGHGLSYTKFEYSNLTVSENEITDDKTLTVMVDVTNTGDRDGMEVVQLYVSDKESSVRRPVRELKGFEKLSLKAGETKKAVFHLDKRSFAYYETDIHDWFVEYGEFGIEVGSSSRDIRLTTSVYVSSDTKLPVHFTLNTTCGEINSIPEGRAMFESIFGQIDCGFGDTASDDMGAAAKEMQESMLRDMPLRTMVTFTNIPDITRAKISEMVENLNQMLAEK